MIDNERGEMIQFQAQVPIGNMPINLVLIGNRSFGAVVFVPVARVGVIVEEKSAGRIGSYFDANGFTLYGDGVTAEFHYDIVYMYKDIPVMLEWLIQQNLSMPSNVVWH